jgi:hypothetical protein
MEIKPGKYVAVSYKLWGWNKVRNRRNLKKRNLDVRCFYLWNGCYASVFRKETGKPEER